MAKQTQKKVKLLCSPDTFFLVKGEKIKASDLTVEQAEKVAAQYPGSYLEVIEEKVKVAEIESPIS